MKKKLLLLTICMIAIWGTSMIVHAQPKTMSDGTVFDAEYYADTYADVKAAFGNDETALYNHYVQYGKAEGRRAYESSSVNKTSVLPDKSIFDPVFYANTYPDVKATFGNDANALYQHYMKYGKAEGRQAVASANVAIIPSKAAVVSTEIKSMNSPTLKVTYGSLSTLADGTQFFVADASYMNFLASTYIIDKKYLIPRTDYGTGIIDNDKNGIDDRDPYNNCGYTDLNYNYIADGAPCGYYTLQVDYEALGDRSNLSLQERLSNTKKVYITEDKIGSGKVCEHGIVKQGWGMFFCSGCYEYSKSLNIHWE